MVNQEVRRDNNRRKAPLEQSQMLTKSLPVRGNITSFDETRGACNWRKMRC